MMQQLGWLATAVFTCSYLAKKDSTLRWIQAVAAALWITYGVLIHAMPVVVANALVAAAAIVTTWRRRTAALASSDSR
jgi:uncharacterized protein with PQ loop repeat